MKHTYKIYVGKSQDKRTLVKPIPRLQNNIKVKIWEKASV
jgi:hypothetical protein